MAIQPIAQYQNPENAIIRILQGGNDAITGILNNAVALSRDRVNNQARQDSQLFQQRQFETGIAQRRGDNLTAQIADAQKFSQSVRESDRRFGLLSQQNEFNQNRTTTQDMFNNTNDAARLDLSREQLNLNAQNMQQDNARMDAATMFNQNIAGQKLALDQEEFNLRKAGGGVNPPTRADLRAEESLQMRKERQAAADAQKAAEQMVIGDTTAFVPQQLSLGTAPPETDKTAFADYQKRKALAEAYDKNAYESEIQSAKNTTEEAYIKNIPNPTPAAIEKRRQLWRLANGAGPVASEQEDPLSDILNGL